ESPTGRVCIVTITAEGSTPVSPSPGHTVRVSGRTVVTATAVYSPAAVPSGESRGCGGERLTPTGCLTWHVNGNYTLTQLYRTAGSPGNNTFTWAWHTSQYINGGRTLTAQVKVNGKPIGVSVPVSVRNADPGVFRSPIPNGGRLPRFPTASR